MNKKIILIIALICLVSLSGCMTSDPKYFDDTGSNVSNYKMCQKLYEESLLFDMYEIRVIECDSGKCFCD